MGRIARVAGAALLLGCIHLASVAQTLDSVITNRLAEPYGVASEANVYYLSDSANDRIIKFVPDTGVFSTLAGFAGRPGTTDAKGVYARFFSPRGIVAVPARHGLIVADYGNHTLRLVKLDGNVTTVAGTPGEPGFDSTHFNFPLALAADTNGVIYIADSKNNAIRKLDLANQLTTVATDLNEPAGIALGDNGELWISDSRNHTIKRLLPGGRPVVVAGITGQSGAIDSVFGEEALFNGPTGLLWLGSNSGLLVADTGNHTIRRVFLDPEIGGYSVETYAGTPTFPGLLDGPVRQAKLKLPATISKDPTGGLLVVDLGNSALRRIQTAAPQPPVRDPIIGYVTFEKDQFGELLSRLVPVSQAVFNNDEVIAILAEPGTETFFTYGATPASTLEDTIPSPSPSGEGQSPHPYRDGVRPSEVAPSIVSPQPDITIKAIGTQDGRRPSQVIQARFQFKTANPIIYGDNPAAFSITSITSGAEMWFTTDGSEPVQGPPSRSINAGPASLPRSNTPTTFRIRAFRQNYKPSEIVSKVFSPDDFQANRITFGFENGEASSEFVASAGQTFFAPVTLSLLPNQKMYTLQFNLAVVNGEGAPAVEPGAVGFESMLQWNLEKDTYLTIPPAMFLNGKSLPFELQSLIGPGYGDLVSTNAAANLLAVAWLERAGKTNLYDTTKQDLISYSIAHDTVFLSKNQKVIVGGYSFKVPPGARDGSTYQIQIDRPSATSDGINQDNYIEAATNGTVTASPDNRPNSIKLVTVGQRRYIVGDVAPFRWFNAGDFGEGFLINNDLVQVFQSAIYRWNQPPKGSDFFDAMDSSNGLTNAAALTEAVYGGDTKINEILFGDGYLMVDDVYVTFRRSLDHTLNWYQRYWENGELKATNVANVKRGSPSMPGERLTSTSALVPLGSPIPGNPALTVAPDDQVVAAGQTIHVPVRSRVVGPYPLRVLMLNVTLEPLDGSPALEQAVEFLPADGLGSPTLTTSRGVNNFAGAWLNSGTAGLAGEGVVGYVKATIPPTAGAQAAYRLHFDHLSGSPNGMGLFPTRTQDGLVTLQNRSGSSLADGIPDTWRLRYFGSAVSRLGDASLDPDGDGASNLVEFKAGTNPADPNSRLWVAAHAFKGGPGSKPLMLRWASTLSKRYWIESAPSLQSSTWTVLTPDLLGTGEQMQFAPADLSNSAQFFRVRVAE
jgi:sugar lactone lactonase YvrE